MACKYAQQLAFMLCVVHAASTPLNVLFIVSDDLRTEMGCYGCNAITKNVDRLAASNGTVLFERAYVQQAVCECVFFKIRVCIMLSLHGFLCAYFLHTQDLLPHPVLLLNGPTTRHHESVGFEDAVSGYTRCS